MERIYEIKSLLQQQAKEPSAKVAQLHFKMGPGSYSEHDQFIAVRVPILRKIAKEFSDLSLQEMQSLIESPINEERQLCLFILVAQYQKAKGIERDELYQFYMRNLVHVNNWNLVDASAHLILGAYILEGDKSELLALAQSKVMWERRIAIVATWIFIRKSQLEWTFKIAAILLQDSHDLIHKAVGWMLREAGKRDQEALMEFLDQYAGEMPRTMLRYAIEKFTDIQRKEYLQRKC